MEIDTKTEISFSVFFVLETFPSLNTSENLFMPRRSAQCIHLVSPEALSKCKVFSTRCRVWGMECAGLAVGNSVEVGGTG